MFFSWCLVISCLLVVQINSVAKASVDLQKLDKYHALEVDAYDLKKLPWKGVQKSEIQKLNEFMIEKTDSADPDVNLDIVQKELDFQLKKKVPFGDLSIQAKRLILALRTLNGENECNEYGYLILRNNLDAIYSPTRAILRNEGARRIDKILAHYINRHVKNCREQYFKRFDQIYYSSLDEVLLHRLDVFLDKAVKTITSDENERNAGKSYAQRLFDEAERGFLTSYIKPSYMYNVMVESVKGHEEEKYMKKVENEKTGYPAINRKVFDRVFYETIAEPCKRLRALVGPDVFQPLLFDGFYHHQVQEERTDFYEALLKYELCKFDYSDSKMLQHVVNHVFVNEV